MGVDGAAIQLGGGSGNRLNPLDPGPRDPALPDSQWQSLVANRRRALVGSLAQSALGRPLVSVEHSALDVALAGAASAALEPTLPLVVDLLLEPRSSLPGSTPADLARDGRDLAHALRRLVAGDLGGLFDGPSTISFDPTLPMVSLDLSQIQGSDQLIAMVMTCASAWMESALSTPDGGQRWAIYDEAWRLMGQPALLARMQSQWKLSRGVGGSTGRFLLVVDDPAAVQGRAVAAGATESRPSIRSTGGSLAGLSIHAVMNGRSGNRLSSGLPRTRGDAPSVAPTCRPEDVRPVRHRRRSGQVAAEDQRRATVLFHLAFEREADLECHSLRCDIVRTNDCDQMLNPGVPSSIPHCRGRFRGVPLTAQFGQHVPPGLDVPGVFDFLHGQAAVSDKAAGMGLDDPESEALLVVVALVPFDPAARTA